MTLLYLDVHFPASITRKLRRRGVSVLTAPLINVLTQNRFFDMKTFAIPLLSLLAVQLLMAVSSSGDTLRSIEFSRIGVTSYSDPRLGPDHRIWYPQIDDVEVIFSLDKPTCVHPVVHLFWSDDGVTLGRYLYPFQSALSGDCNAVPQVMIATNVDHRTSIWIEPANLPLQLSFLWSESSMVGKLPFPIPAHKYLIAVLGQFTTITASNVYVIQIIQSDVLPTVLIPGIGGSELHLSGLNGRRIWPTLLPQDIDSLNLRTGAENVQATKIVSSYLGKEFYGPAMSYLTSPGVGYTEFLLEGDRSRMTSTYMLTHEVENKPTLFPFPYDWRQSNSSHVQTLAAYISRIRLLHFGAKVNVLAHSMGGLIARRYIVEEFRGGGIDRVVTVATPFWGAPDSIYTMLTGKFYPSYWDWVTNSEMKNTLSTLAGAHELLPSDHYFQIVDSQVLSEERWDFNDSNDALEVYTVDQYRETLDSITAQLQATFINPRGTLNKPSLANMAFHNYENPQQDDWNSDNNNVYYLHICGLQDTQKTIVEVIATERAFGLYHRLRPRLGMGDGTVPLLSAARPDPFLYAPGTFSTPGVRTQTNVLSGPDDEVEHNALMRNSTVLSWINHFLRGEAVPMSPAPVPGPVVRGATTGQFISITGVGYVRIVDAMGNENTRLSEIAAEKIPGVDVDYGGGQTQVEIAADDGRQLTIYGTASDAPLEVVAVRAKSSMPVSLRRFRFNPASHSWQAHAGSELVVRVDVDDSGTYEVSEQISPTHTSDLGATDVVQPLVEMRVSRAVGGVDVQLAASDNISADPVIRYSIDDGPLQNYTEPLSFDSGEGIIVKAFAEDAMGNTSGLITTAVVPRLSIRGLVGATAALEWTRAEAYVLEETTDLSSNGWLRSSVQTSRNLLTDSVRVPVDGTARKFFRLRSETVMK